MWRSKRKNIYFYPKVWFRFNATQKRGNEIRALEKSFNVSQRERANKECTRMFYASYLTFKFTKSPYFKDYSRTLANNSLPIYTPPAYNK